MLKRKGFTLIEMVFVIFIISLLLLIVIPNISKQKDIAIKKTDKAFITMIQTQADLYDERNVSLNELEKNGFISSEQLKKANEKGIKIENGQVIQR